MLFRTFLDKKLLGGGGGRGVFVKNKKNLISSFVRVNKAK